MTYTAIVFAWGAFVGVAVTLILIGGSKDEKNGSGISDRHDVRQDSGAYDRVNRL
ncbi:hypothetical protein [Liquorilactobacillus capillatus]|uniref:Uncharacterized protein n=1 Tax=Liquorilactobacillus capillatus DSM 19910 TaxID=1423731 RepID=A0A0R1M413_9LACO|nr:hypothetical protein [Liquorilactobacillus capillatus]KRL02497.1 hypothetical protein FC81_GL000662 [Liquorilactobacillus capillatus DSM 19910]